MEKFKYYTHIFIINELIINFKIIITSKDFHTHKILCSTILNHSVSAFLILLELRLVFKFSFTFSIKFYFSK